MRFFIRNKAKYNPEDAFKNAIVAVDVDNTQEIGKIKEEARKIAKGSKITALYVARQDGSFIDLADDRTINYYNLQDGMILETSSNPFWVTTLYSNLKRREQDAADNPDDARLCTQAQRSIIHRFMAIGLLLNGTGKTEKQPPTFHELDDLYEYCMTKGKKPAHMSQFTVNELQEMFDSYNEEYTNKIDPVGSFIYSQALKLGFVQDNTIDGDDPFRSYFQQNTEQQRALPAARQNRDQNGNNRGAGQAPRRRANNNRMCDDCEVAMAAAYCGDCNPPLCLCDNCWMTLHRGATRRNHQRRDLSEAPRQTSYVPQAYRAPFAMLVAFHRASQEILQKGSLSADEIKQRGQPFTDTDLQEAKQRGKPFSGFDSLENALMKNNIVKKEAAGTPKYSLEQCGQGLALKCSNFDYAVQSVLQQASVPTLPPLVQNPTVNNRQVCLLVDTEEPQKDRFVKYVQDRGLNVKVRKLPSGDFCWILLPHGAQAQTVDDMPDQELVLPYLVERKTWDDLWTSIRTPRFESQVQRMKSSGIKNLFYLVEGSPKDISGRPGPEIEAFLQGKLDRLLLEDNFFVNRTPSWCKTVEWLCHLTHLATEYQQTGWERNLITFAEFTRNTNHLNVNKHRIVKPSHGIVWSADEFAGNIRSHHTNGRDIGRVLDHVPRLPNSILIIQGLTAYNTNCHSLYKKTLADYLKMPGQKAEECVQIHLEDYTDQLISVNVFQYFNLHLEISKGVRIYRTETKEETQEFLTRLNVPQQNNHVVAMMAHADHNTNNGFNDNQPEQKAAVRMENNLMFANDSQEEDYMLQQALQESIAEDETSQTHHNNVGETSTTTYQEHKSSTSNLSALPSTSATTTNNNTSGYNTASNTVQVKDTQHTYHKNNGETSTMTYQEYKPSTSNLGALPSTSTQTTNNTTGYNTASNDVQVKEETTEEEDDLQSILQFKFYDEIQSSLQEESSSTHIQQEELNESPDEDLKKVLEQSLQDEQGSTQQEKTNESPDEDLKKVLEQSRLQYEQEQKKTQNRKGQGNSIKKGDGNIHFRRNSRDADLQKALRESRKQYRQEQKSSQAREILQKKEEAKTSNNNEHLANFENRALPRVLQQSTPMRGSSQPNNREKCNDICETKAYSEEEILEKALQESRELFAEQQRRAERDTNIECSKNGATQKSSQESSQKYERHQKSAHCNAGYAQVQKGSVMTEMNKGSQDDDLEKALQESRKQYERQQRIAKMEQRVDAPQVKKEKHDDNKQQSRITFDDEQEQSFPNSEVYCAKKEKTVLQTQDNVPVRYASKDSSTGITKSPSEESTQIANTSSPNKNIQKGSNYNKDHKPSKRSVTHASKNPSTDITQSPSEKSTQRASTYSPKKNAQEGPNKHQQHKFANSPDNELEKVLQQSRLEYEMEKTKEKLASEDYDEEEALQQALELSRIEMENEKMKEKEKDGTDLSSVACSAHQKINEADKEQYVNNAVKEIESEKMDEKKEHEMDKEEDLQNAVTEMESKQMDKREKSGTCFSPANDSFCQREKQKDVRRKSNNPAKETDNEQFEAKEHNIGINTTPTNNAFSISNVLSDSDKNKDKKNFEDSEGLFHELEIPDFVNENSNNRNQSLSNICTTSTPKSSNSINQSVPVLSRCKESFRDNAARSNPSISNSVTEVSRSSTDDVENEPSHSNSVTMVTEVSWSSTDDVENEPSLSNSVTEVSRRSTDDENEVVGRQEKDESGIDTRNQTPDEHKVDVSSASFGVDVILIDIQDDNDNDYHDDDNEVAVCAKDSSKSYTRSNSLDNINNNSSNNINDNSTNIDPSNQNDDDDGYSVIDTYHDDGATLIDSQGDDYHNSSSNYNNNSASIDPSIRQVQNDYDDDVDNPVIDSYHHDDATLIDSQDNDDHDIYNNNGASIDPSSDQVQNDDDDNNVIDSYHHDDAILIDSQDDNFDNSMQHGEEHNSDTEDTCNNQVNITPHNIYSSKSSDSQNDSSANDHHTRHRDPKTTKTSATFDPGLSFRQKAEAIARGKISLMSLTMSKDNGNHSPRHRPDKRGFDGAVKGNIAPSSSPSPSTSFKSHNSRPSNSTDCIGGKRAIQSSGSSMFPSSYSSTSTEDPSSSTTPTNLMRDSRNNSWSLPPSTTASNPSSSKTPANLSRVSRNVSSRFPHSTSSTTDDNKHFGRKRARKSCNSTSTSNPSSSSTTDSANLMIDSGDTIPYSSTTADDEYSSSKIARKSCHSTSTSTQNPSSSSSRNILSSFSLSPSSASSRNEYLGSKRARKSCDTALVFPSSSPSPSQSSHTSIRHDDAILIDSQDDYEEVDSATDLEIARQLQEEWNNEHKDYGSRSNNVTSTSTTGKTWDSDNNKSGSAASNGSLVFPRSSQSSSVNNYTGDSRNTNTPGAFIFPGSSSCPGSSRSRDDDVHGFVFPGSSSSASPRSGPSSDGQGQSSSHSKGTNAPKCSDCGEIGHRKGTKKCPYYYTEEAQRKREEQARKRKEKRDEEDRQQQEKVDALVAQHTQMAEEAEQIRVQIEQFNRRNNNLPRMVEDVSKLLKKRRKK